MALKLGALCTAWMPAGAIAVPLEVLVVGATGWGGDGMKLRRKEQDAIRRPEALADYWPDTLRLDSASGTLTVMEKGERTKTLRPSLPCSGRASATKGLRTKAYGPADGRVCRQEVKGGPRTSS